MPAATWLLSGLVTMGLGHQLVATPSTCRAPIPSETGRARMAVHAYAFDAFPLWSFAHPGLPCPASLAELDHYIDRTDTLDPWGRHYLMQCGPDVPDGARGVLVVRSAGPDRTWQSQDDINSWE
jgi:hypothetical protein